MCDLQWYFNVFSAFGFVALMIALLVIMLNSSPPKRKYTFYELYHFRPWQLPELLGKELARKLLIWMACVALLVLADAVVGWLC